jgi:hypothetical protein
MALGNDTALTLVDATSGTVIDWDWVTNVAEGWGAPIDSPITALAYGPDGTLYIGNAVCLNIRFVNGSYARIDGPAGLPAANITSLSIDTSALAEVPARNLLLPRVWIGTTTGAILFDPSVDPAADVNAAGPAIYYGALRRSKAMKAVFLRGTVAAPAILPHNQRWRFLRGPRYLPVTPAATLATPVASHGIVCIGNSAYVLSSVAGVAVLTAELWTLARKAAWMETLQVGMETQNLLHFAPVNRCTVPWTGLLRFCSRHTTANTSGLVVRVTFQLGVLRRTSRASLMIQTLCGQRLSSQATSSRLLSRWAALDANTILCPLL